MPALPNLLGAGEVGFAVADLVVAVDCDFDGAVGVGGASWFGVVAEAVLGAEFAVGAVEDVVQFLNLIGIEHGAAHRIGDGVERVFTRGVPTAFVFHGAHDDGVKQRAGFHGSFARGVEVGVARGFASVGYEDDDAAAIFAAAFELARTEQDRVVQRC